MDYATFRQEYIADHYRCEFDFVGQGQSCFEEAMEVHHILTRGRSGRDADLIDSENVLALCDEHHKWIHANQREALALGYLKKARPRQ